MAQTPAIDTSQYQGDPNWPQVPQQIVLTRMSYSYNGQLLFDPKGGSDYYGAKAAGKHIGGYHFAGGTDPVQEAEFFIRAMSPLAENDVMALDWEIQNPNPVGWCNTFLTHVHDRTGVWPLIYLNISTLNAYDWSPVLANCGLWLAAPSYGFNEDIPQVHKPYIMQQGPTVIDAGITGNVVDTDMWFDTPAVFDKYGYHAQALPAPAPPAPAPTTTTTTTEAPAPPAPEPTTTTTTTEAPDTPPDTQPTDPKPSQTTTTTTSPGNSPNQVTALWKVIIAFLVASFNRLRGV